MQNTLNNFKKEQRRGEPLVNSIWPTSVQSRNRRWFLKRTQTCLIRRLIGFSTFHAETEQWVFVF